MNANRNLIVEAKNALFELPTSSNMIGPRFLFPLKLLKRSEPLRFLFRGGRDKFPRTLEHVIQIRRLSLTFIRYVPGTFNLIWGRIIKGRTTEKRMNPKILNLPRTSFLKSSTRVFAEFDSVCIYDGKSSKLQTLWDR
jgi:hypothetical protein